MPILETRNLCKIYPGAEQVVALNRVNLTLEKGELIAVMGDSGSGKSTLLHMLAGVDHPTEGQVLIQDVDITSLNEKEIIKHAMLSLQHLFYRFGQITIHTDTEPLLERLQTCSHQYLYSSLGQESNVFFFRNNIYNIVTIYCVGKLFTEKCSGFTFCLGHSQIVLASNDFSWNCFLQFLCKRGFAYTALSNQCIYHF